MLNKLNINKLNKLKYNKIKKYIIYNLLKK